MSLLRIRRIRRSILVTFFLPFVLSGCLLNEPDENSIQVDPPAPDENRAPNISGSPPSVIKVGVAYSFTPEAADADSDPLTFSINNRPNWITIDSSTGTIFGVPSLGNEGTYNDIELTVSDGQASTMLPRFSITVEPANAPNMPPEISGNPPTNAIVGQTYLFSPSASDPDGDALMFSIINLPGWASFSTTSGQISGTPLASDEGFYGGISITVSDNISSSSLPTFSITVSAVNAPPTISGAPETIAPAESTYSFTPTATDPNGDSLTFSVQNLPSWATFDQNTGTLSGIPAIGDIGIYSDVNIEVTDGVFIAALPAFSVEVVNPNGNPTISGVPDTVAVIGGQYQFTPNATDPDGDAMTFMIQNPPGWSQFDSTSGNLSGTPQPGDQGTYPNIVISVTDGTTSDSLPAFSIDVVNANSAPQISGTPNTTVDVGKAYSFIPVASDPDGDTLTFSITNSPSWAQFDGATGQLSGTPQIGDAGMYSGISIAVSDGELIDTLPPFSITVNQVSLGTATLSWTAPTQNTDGSPLTDLAGFKIYYGNSSGNYSNVEIINNPGVTTFVLENLSDGTWYFVSTSFNTAGVESQYSNEASKTITSP